ncbi:MAG: GNAT family N-acetyltransferase [Bacteroidales bacterium]|nr:GNAT family N-acetyltransferase [Bacteroidales bacterium]HOY40015.1 GNAT family N-acetyltransferase [Bacteroidales bacterium]HQP04703.1 GNAT family N-acetyltransferase [Bacteroidales bacterium]
MKARNASYNDLETLTGFQIQMAYETEGIKLNEEVVRKGITAVIHDSTRGKYIVVENEKKIIACCMITPEWSDWRCCWVLWLQSVYVEPAYRSTGVFKFLFNHIKKQVINSSEYAGIRLYVDKRNQSAAAIYTKLNMNSDHYYMFEWLKNENDSVVQM